MYPYDHLNITVPLRLVSNITFVQVNKHSIDFRQADVLERVNITCANAGSIDFKIDVLSASKAGGIAPKAGRPP